MNRLLAHNHAKPVHIRSIQWMNFGTFAISCHILSTVLNGVSESINGSINNRDDQKRFLYKAIHCGDLK